MADYASFVDYVLRVGELFDDVENCVGIPRRRLRDRINPMDHYTDSEFLARYRFTKCSVKKLLDCLPLEESCSNRGHPLPPMTQLLIALRFYGAGTFQVVAGDLVNVSQPTVSRIIERVSRVIAKHLFPAVVKFPDTDDGFRETMVEFHRIAKFPGVTGCIDCTHIRIKAPHPYKSFSQALSLARLDTLSVFLFSITDLWRVTKLHSNSHSSRV